MKIVLDVFQLKLMKISTALVRKVLYLVNLQQPHLNSLKNRDILMKNNSTYRCNVTPAGLVIFLVLHPITLHPGIVLLTNQ